jgi:hypothetical protein
MYIVTLEEAKKQLNIEPYFTEDDIYISTLIEVSFSYIKNVCNNITWVDASGSTGSSEFADFNSGSTSIPLVVKQGILLMVSNLYANREPVSFGSPVKIPHTLDALISSYVNYGL